MAAYREAARVDPAGLPRGWGRQHVARARENSTRRWSNTGAFSKLDGMAEAGAVGEARLLILKNLTRRPNKIGRRVNRLLDQLAKNSPDSIGVIVLRAESLSGRQHRRGGEDLLAARTKSPDRIELWTALVGLCQPPATMAEGRAIAGGGRQKIRRPGLAASGPRLVSAEPLQTGIGGQVASTGDRKQGVWS